MFNIFNGKTRGLGASPSDSVYMKVEVDFRHLLHHFKGASLAVFIAIALHADEKGESFPGYDLLEKETGYGSDTIAAALKKLCDLTIDGHRVLVKRRVRNQRGQYDGNNHYLIFPSPEEVQIWENPSLVESKLGKIQEEEEPVLKAKPLFQEEPSLKEKNGGRPPALSPQTNGGTAPRKGDVKQESLLGDVEAVEQPTSRQHAYFEKVCSLLGYDSRLMSKKDRQVVAGLVRAIRKHEATYTLAFLDAFLADWWQNEWRKDRKIFPTPANLQAELGKFHHAQSLTVDSYVEVTYLD